MKKLFVVILSFLMFACSEDEQLEIEKVCEEIPDLKTNAPSEISKSSAVLSGFIAPPDCNKSIISQGFVFGLETLPEIENASKVKAVGCEYECDSITSVQKGITDLQENSKYYYRTYLINSIGTYYGNQKNFTTDIGDAETSLDSVSSITATSANISSGISSDGGAEITLRGVCWDIDTNPTIENDTTEDGSGLGVFESIMENLTSNTTYYVRSYAVNQAGVTYGEEVSFTTQDGIGTITSNKVTSIGTFTAELEGNVSDDGGAPITERGVCWSINSSPTITDSKTIDGQGTGVFQSEISGLKVFTKYYVRAYAVNEIGVFYGEVLSFTTKSGVATITASQVSSIGAFTAELEGIVSDDGGAPITERGVCWSINSSPTITDSKTIDGQGTGVFQSEISGLKVFTKYYVRAYVVNEIGIFYGEVLSFTTKSGVATITTSQVSSIGAFSVLSGGNVISDGGLQITSKGVCWSKNTNPTIDDFKTSDGQGLGTFDSELEDLEPNTTYYVRSYATNELDTFYGDEIVFTKQSPLYLSDNGVTIKARSWAAIGDVSLINGVSYELVSTNELFLMASRGDEMTTVCTSRVTSMDGLFNGNDAFNQDIGSWDVSNVSNMRIMFQNTSSFDQDLNYWDVSKVTDMRWLFNGATSFNGNISNWDVSNISSMRIMFQNASSFNQDLNYWDVSKVTDMGWLFNGATSFNGEIGNWDVGNVTSMNIMFQDAKAFNQNLNAWDVSKVTNMQFMFTEASAFNGNVSNWNVGKVTDMKFMFSRANSFNQNLENWNVSAVTTMEGMFLSAIMFNSSLSKWNVRNVRKMDFMLLDARSFSSANYTEFLDGIMIRSQFYDPQGVVLHASSKYCSSVARNYLINGFNWTIFDGGYTFTCN